MERLTERLDNRQAAVMGCGENCKYDYKYCRNHYEDCPEINRLYERLAEYEDTGLTPEEILELKERDTAKAIVHNRTRDINGIIVFNSKLCSNCGRSCSDDYDDYNFCPDCGQRLKWEG